MGASGTGAGGLGGQAGPTPRSWRAAKESFVSDAWCGAVGGRAVRSPTPDPRGGTLLERDTNDPATQESRYANLEGVSELAGVNQTAEAVARRCWEKLLPSLRHGGPSSLAVSVWGSPDVYAARRHPLN